VQKTGEPIDVQFGETHVDHWNHVLGGVPIPLGKGIFLGGQGPVPVKRLNHPVFVHAECNHRCHAAVKWSVATVSVATCSFH